MALPVLILGESGTGKSASLRNFPQDEIGVVNVAGKPLPFKNKIASVSTDDYIKVERAVKEFVKDGKKAVVVDDAQYLMANEFMRRATEKGYDKFTDIAKNFWSLINMVKDLSQDVIVYFLAHIERDQNGNEKIKTIGKLLDEKITVEGMFTIVLKTNVTDGQYFFLTQNNGHDTVKSPIGMFPTYAIDNDLNYVDEKIRNYYEMGLCLTDEELEELDKIKGNTEIQKEEKKGRRARGKKDDTGEPEKETTGNTRSRRKVSEVGNSNTAEQRDEAGGSSENSTGQDDTAAGQQSEPDKVEDKPESGRRRRKVSDGMGADREEVKKANEEAVANAGLEEVEDENGVPFDGVETPEMRELPRRKRRTTSEEASESGATPTRRRRRNA